MSQSVALMAPLSPKRADKVSHSVCGERSLGRTEEWGKWPDLAHSINALMATWAPYDFVEFVRGGLFLLGCRAAKVVIWGIWNQPGGKEGGCLRQLNTSPHAHNRIICHAVFNTYLGWLNYRYLKK